MPNGDINWIAGFIWNIADDVLRDLYVRGKYRDVILPMTVILRRLDAVLEPTKQAVSGASTSDARQGSVSSSSLRCASPSGSGTGILQCRRSSPCAIFAPAPSQQQLKADFEAYLDGFSPKRAGDSGETSSFATRFPRLVKGRCPRQRSSKNYSIQQRSTSAPNPVNNPRWQRSSMPGLDNHAMGTIFEELDPSLQRGEQRGGGRTLDAARRAVKLMARPDLPACRRRDPSPALIFVYDGACGTGGMLTVAEETLQRAGYRMHDKKVAIAPVRPRDQSLRRMPSVRQICCSRARDGRRG